MPTFLTMRTNSGYFCGEVTSSMQKEIRRGHEREALFWATELDQAGYGNYVWKRLRIIASEDVGIADSSVAVLVRSLYENWIEAKRNKDDKQDPARLFLIHAVIALARAPKSRIVDNALMVMYEGERPHPDIPDYAYDKHTNKGRSLGRGVDHFFDVGAKLNNCKLKDPYEKEGRASRKAHEESRKKPKPKASTPPQQRPSTNGRKAAPAKPKPKHTQLELSPSAQKMIETRRVNAELRAAGKLAPAAPRK